MKNPKEVGRYLGYLFLLVIIIVPLIFLAPPPKEAAATLDTEPTRKAEIIIQSSKVSATLTDFPVLLTEDNMPSEACDADGTSPAQDGGGDIRFTSDENGNNQLPLEVIKFSTANDPTNCSVEMYVKVPSVSSTTDTSIWMWYNTATNDSQPLASSIYGSENVWDSNYKGVWHLGESSGARSDATANGNDLTDNNTVTSASGKWGTAADFEKDNSEYTSRADNTSLSIIEDLTFSTWVNLESGPSSGNLYPLVAKYGNDPNKSYFFAYYNNSGTNTLLFQISNDGSAESYGFVNQTLSTGTWYHVAVKYDASAGSATFFVNGSQVGTTQTGLFTSIKDGTAELRLFSRELTGFYSDGLMQGTRISSAIRSNEWISAEYNNQNDPATFAIEQAPQESLMAPESSTVIKSADQNVASSTTLTDDSELTFTLKANTKYVISGGVFATSTSSQPDVKIGFTTPTGSTMDIAYLAQGGNTRTAELLETSGGESAKIDIPGNENTIMQLMGSVTTVGTAGNLKFQWAQNSSNATTTTVKQGSFITVTEATE